MLTGSAWQTSADGWVHALRDSEREWEVQLKLSAMADLLACTDLLGIDGRRQEEEQGDSSGRFDYSSATAAAGGRREEYSVVWERQEAQARPPSRGECNRH